LWSDATQHLPAVLVGIVDRWSAPGEDRRDHSGACEMGVATCPFFAKRTVAAYAQRPVCRAVLTLPYPVITILPFICLAWYAEFRGRSGRSGYPPMSLGENSFDHFDFTIFQCRKAFVRQ
jgi:hypothetical protein